MKVDYVFSRNKKWGSRLIAWAAKYEKVGLDKNPSHVGVLLNDAWVVESTFSTGVRVLPYESWKKINEELYRIPCAQKYRSSNDVMSHTKHIWGKKYDWFGVLYFAISYLRLILFNKPLPKKNKWQRNSRYFCTEYPGRLVSQDYSMTSPARMCAEWLGSVK